MKNMNKESIELEELNKEYNKYSQAIAKLLDSALKEGDTYLFRKNKYGSYGMVLSEERENFIKTSETSETRIILDTINHAFKVSKDWIAGKVTL